VQIAGGADMPPDGVYFTPPGLGKKWVCKPERVIEFIASGELEAFNVARSGCKRARWRISPEAIARFEAARSAIATAKPVRSRKRQTGYVRRFV
jgi:hypothetical protein